MAHSSDISGTTLVLGGARSGKSAFAENMFDAQSRAVYVATAENLGGEMDARIKAHQKRRGGNWTTLEEPLNLVGVIDVGEGAPMLVDCLTLWLSNLMHQDRNLEKEIAALARAAENAPFPLVLVSNEVGGGIVPENKMAREFCDFAGTLNQEIAAAADHVYLVTAGLPQKLK
ncbi:MAG: bifunctional adenosylcobinamide kinase/adenosylcobinamide-phosphate guanylyltransferase [Rhodospirillales bacterium]|nr:bifunctional adenosylcobinamide kinase/adenosylcobinamide-phosphate guanylyltransferase [Rhodospirillales bacterium]